MLVPIKDSHVAKDKRKKKRQEKRRNKRKKDRESKIASDKFLSSYQWRKVRYEALQKYGAKCMCCGRTKKEGAIMNVDHIKPRKKYPELALDINNLQILCGPCNHGKGNWDETDFRPSLVDVMLTPLK